MNSPSEDFKDILVSSSAATGLIFATDLFVGFEPEHDLTTPIVTLFDTGGDRPQVNFVYHKVRIQARIRGAKFGYQAAYTMAETVRDALHELTLQTVNGTKYIAIWAISDIFPLGQDEKSRPIFTVNFEAHRTA
jgi:hypothetical protein